MPLGSPGEFDAWAESYDRSVRDETAFPFLGYRRVLERIVELALPLGPANSVVDLGIGTGNLAVRLREHACGLAGLDYSAAMLELAARKLPGVPLAPCDLLDAWPEAIPRRHDRLVSAYVFHHFDLGEKVKVLARLAGSHLRPGGRLIVGDIAFPTGAARDECRHQWGDAWDEEHYWVADEIIPACRHAGLEVCHEQVNELAGVFVVTRRRS